MRRRALEKMVAIPLAAEDAGDAEGVALDGIWLGASVEEGARAEPRGAAVIAAPHPLYGGRMDNPVVTELAFACERADLESLRFDWRGVGGSGGEASGDLAQAVRDVDAALAHVEAGGHAMLVACGYSFGAAAVVRASGRHPRVRRLVLVAPPPSMLDRDAFAAFPGDVLVLVGARDALASPDALAPWVEAHPRARLERIPEADHFFTAGLADVGRHAGDFLRAPRS